MFDPIKQAYERCVDGCCDRLWDRKRLWKVLWTIGIPLPLLVIGLALWIVVKAD